MNRIESPIFSIRKRNRIVSRRRFIKGALQLATASVLVAPTLVTPGGTVFPWSVNKVKILFNMSKK